MANNYAVVTFGGKRAQADDIARIATNKCIVAIDKSLIADMARNVPPKDDLLFVPNEVSASGTHLPVELCRGAVASKLASLLHVKWLRVDILQVLVRMLNDNVLPCFTGLDDAGEQLVAALTLTAFPCYTSSGVICASSALSSMLGGVSLGLTSKEVDVLRLRHSYIAGAAAVIAAGTNNLLRCIDVVAAYTADVLGAPVADSCDVSRFETARPQRSQISSATNLKLLLEGSKHANTAPASTKSMECFRYVPQVHGPAVDAAGAVLRSIDVELNAVESTVISDKNDSFDATQSRVAVQCLSVSLKVAKEASVQRVVPFGAAVATALPASDAVDADTKLFVDTYHDLLMLSQSLSLEVQAADARISSINAAANEAREKKESAKANTAGEEAGRKKEEEDLSGMSEEQRARIEAKRKAKADKANAKAKAKEAKKSVVGNIVLGVGCMQVREYLVAAAGASSPFVIDAFDFTENSFCSYCVALLERLNSGGKRRPKLPKGARDFLPDQMRIREQAFAVIRRVFKRHGAVEIDTPVFELKEVLTGKYGEDSKLIYDLADQGGELLSLRYDLTVPFARFLAMNSTGNIKRYHMAKVYRRDNPAMNRGRYREFYQCDFDIAGSYSPMVADAEAITVATEILSALPIGSFMLKINHRRILDAIFEICGVPAEKFRPICSAVDKLDKSPWEEVKAEMVNEKGLPESVADKIGVFVLHRGAPWELWQRMSDEKMFGEHAAACAAMEEMKTLFTYLEAMGSLQYISFDMSLARGLDYYTGVIYEAVLTDGESQLGSIAAGGRYDNLVGMFSASGQQTPCVGVSIGIERVFTIMERKAEQTKAMEMLSDVQVYVASIGANLLPQRMRVARLLWERNISCEYSAAENPKLKRQMEEVLSRRIPVMVIFGDDEVAKGVVKVKNMQDHVETEVSLTDVVQSVLNAGAHEIAAGADLNLLNAMI